MWSIGPLLWCAGKPFRSATLISLTVKSPQGLDDSVCPEHTLAIRDFLRPFRAPNVMV